MEQFYTMVSVQATLFIYIAVGYLLSKFGKISKPLRGALSNLTLEILLPCMVFDSLNRALTAEDLVNGAVILAMAFFFSLVAWITGWVCWRKYPSDKRAVLRFGTLIANSSFAGLPVIQGAYGADGMFLASFFIIANRILMWTAGISLFSSEEKTNIVKKTLLNPNIVAVFLGLSWSLLSLPLPDVFAETIASVGNCTSPISLIVVGAVLADVDWHTVFDRDVILASGVRLILLPFIALAVMYLLNFDSLSTAVAVVLTGMPIGSTTVILAEKYNSDSLFASKFMFVSTLLSLLTMPVLTLFL